MERRPSRVGSRGRQRAPDRRPDGHADHREAALLRLTGAIAAAHDEAEIYRSMVEGLHDEAIGYDFLGVFLLDPATGDRVLQASVGWDRIPRGMRVHPGEGLRDAVAGGLRARGGRIRADDPALVDRANPRMRWDGPRRCR